MSKRIVSLVLPALLALAMAFPLHTAPLAQLTFPALGTVNSTANIRNGPGQTNTIVGSATTGQAVTITGCNADCSWYKVGDAQWIAAFLVDVASSASVATIPATDSTGGSLVTLVSWNVESGGALQSVVADSLAAFDGVDIWGLSEVSAIDAEAYEFGAEEGEGADYESLLGTTGRADRLLLIWDASRFEKISGGELREIGETGRAPLWVQLRDRATLDEMIVMVNHLHRSNEGIRHRQGTALNKWAAQQTLPVVAMGDYNFDWELEDGEQDHDIGYDNLTANGVWEWVRPAQLTTTQCSG